MRFILVAGLAFNTLLGSAISGVYLILEKQRAIQPHAECVCGGESIDLTSTVLTFVGIIAWFMYLVVAASIARRNHLRRLAEVAEVTDMVEQSLITNEIGDGTTVNAIGSPQNVRFSIENDDDRQSSELNGGGGDSSSGNAS